MKPIIAINFKTYKQGKDVVKLARAIENNDKDMIICVPATYIEEVAKKTKLKVYAQHVDFYKAGRATGFILPENVKADGAKGTLLNHSEHPIEFNVLEKTIKRCKQVGLKVILCISEANKTKKFLKLNPDMIALEVPELIATGKSISQNKPKSVMEFSYIVGNYNIKEHKHIKPLCGAGISDSKDVREAMNLGCDGVLIASAITKSKNPGKSVREIEKG